MRKKFVEGLLKLAQEDENLYLLVGDLGFGVVEPFKQAFPDRFINIGICEQNMIGVAAGLAMAGKKVFVYSIIPFVTMRCFEQVRLDLCYQNLPVRLVGVGGGFSYGSLGSTHHAVEDIAIMRALPNMTVLSPASAFEMENLISQANDLPGPVYFRITQGQEFSLYPKNIEIKVGKAIEVIPNNSNLIFTTGDSLNLGFDVCKKLKEFGLDFGLVSLPTIKPLDSKFLLSKHDLQAVFTIEEHSVIGGLGETIASFILQNFEKKVVFRSFGIQDYYCHEIGSRAYLQAQAGLTVEKISDEILQSLKSVQFSTMKTSRLQL